MATGDDTKLLEFVTNQLAHPDEFIALVTSLNNSNRQSLDKIEFIDGRVLERFSTPLDKDNIQEGRVWSFRDITERVHFDKTLAESEQKYRGIHEASSEGCWIIDPVTTETLDINESLCSLIGYHRDEIIGKTPMEFVDNENKEILRAQTSKILTTQHRHYDVALRHKNGSNIPCIFNASTIYIDDEAKFSVAFVTDITEHVQAKRVLQVARQEAENANKAKSEFLSRMSHELRTPLNAVLGFGQLLQIDNENFSEIQKKGIDHIYNSGKHLLELINEVLDIAKVDAGKMTVNIEDISVNEFIDDSISMVYSLTRKKHINISRTPVDINYHIKADKLRFKQVLLNLLSNAAKYNNEGGSITIDQVASEDGMLRILVTDTGPGIQTKDHIKVFAPFTRLGTHHNIEGTGVGLTITRKLVKLMGGDIDFSSEYGKGSTFWVELPCSNCEQ